MINDNPRTTLSIVLCGSLIVYGAIAIVILPFISPLIVVREDYMIAVFQGVLIYFFLFLLFLLPSSYVYWSHRIEVKVLGSEPAAAEPDDELNLTVVIGLPRNASPKGAILEAFLGELNIAAQKVEGSPTELKIHIPDVTPGYHKILVRVIQESYFTGSSSYELLIAPADSD